MLALDRLRLRRRSSAQKPKTGFETQIPVIGGAGDFEVEALDAAGQVIGTSKPFAVKG